MEAVAVAHHRRTRRSKVVKIVREKYLNALDGVYGYMHGGEITLSIDDLKTTLDGTKLQHLLVIDTNIALHQIDFLEHRCDAITHIVILQTVLQELRHLNLGVYRRLSAIMMDKSRSFIFLPNEVIVETASFRLEGESPNDANDRAIRNASSVYKDALEDYLAISVILLTNDEDNRKKAQSDKIIAMSVHHYVNKYLKEYPELFDMLATDERFAESMVLDNNSNKNDKIEMIYERHLPMTELSLGLKSKKFHRGVIRCVGDNWEDCYSVIHDNNSRKSVKIQGMHSINRAIDGDVVALEILDKAPLSSSSSNKNNKNSKDQTTVVGDGTLEPTAADIEGTSTTEILYAKVVGIIRRNWRQYAGSLQDNNNDNSIIDMDTTNENSGMEEITSAIFVPVSNRIPMVKITTRRLRELKGQRLLVAIDAWPVTSKLPLGHYVRALGVDGDKDVETAVLLHEFDVPHNAFTPEVMKCLPDEDWCITEDLIQNSNRKDFRQLPVVSIDPPGCKDIDDALHCMTLPNGNLQIGVHIADVTHFVLPETAIDLEAAHRSTSTYLVERRLDMLPGLLTTQLCSLRSGEDHLAFSVLWEMTPDAHIVNATFHKSVIHSVASLTYDEAQAMLDSHNNNDNNDGDDVSTSVNGLAKIARILRNRRISQGALTLASPEVRFRLDSETQNPTDVSAYALKEANALVEEFMLLANITVSKKILRHFPTLGVLRRHQAPSREQFAPLLAAAQAVGVKLDISSSKALADSLDAAVREQDPYFNKLLRILSTRCMMPAQYFCSGEFPSDQWWHYGLAAPVYTHFTSPIRRYADVVVHRLLAAAINVAPLPGSYADRTKQQELCTHMNRRHRAAQHASRASTNLHTVLYFRHRPAIEEAYVLNVGVEAITVLVPKYAIEGRVSLISLSEALGELELNEVTQSVHTKNNDGNKKKRKYQFSLQVLQKVEISIAVIETRDGGERKLQLALVHDGKTYKDEN